MAEANGTTVPTVEALAAGPVVTDGVEQLVAGITSCPEATVSAPQLGTATAAFTALLRRAHEQAADALD
jgi:hypothetical protein